MKDNFALHSILNSLQQDRGSCADPEQQKLPKLVSHHFPSSNSPAFIERYLVGINIIDPAQSAANSSLRNVLKAYILLNKQDADHVFRLESGKIISEDYELLKIVDQEVDRLDDINPAKELLRKDYLELLEIKAQARKLLVKEFEEIQAERHSGWESLSACFEQEDFTIIAKEYLKTGLNIALDYLKLSEAESGLPPELLSNEKKSEIMRYFARYLDFAIHSHAPDDPVAMSIFHTAQYIKMQEVFEERYPEEIANPAQKLLHYLLNVAIISNLDHLEHYLNYEQSQEIALIS